MYFLFLLFVNLVHILLTCCYCSKFTHTSIKGYWFKISTLIAPVCISQQTSSILCAQSHDYLHPFVIKLSHFHLKKGCKCKVWHKLCLIHKLQHNVWKVNSSYISPFYTLTFLSWWLSVLLTKIYKEFKWAVITQVTVTSCDI